MFGSLLFHSSLWGYVDFFVDYEREEAFIRYTNSQLLQATQDACINDDSISYTGLSSDIVFLQREINNTVGDIFRLMKQYRLQPPPYTKVTVASTIYYKFRPGVTKLESMTVSVGSQNIPLKIVANQQEWDRLQQVPISSGFPTHVFPRRDDFGIYPTPQGVYTMNITANFSPVNMTAVDQSDGAVAITNNSATVTGTTTSFTASMEGRWFAITTNGIPSQNFYRIDTVTNATSLTLDRPIVEDTASSQTYLIGESPEIPDELHEFIPFRAASVWYMLRRKDNIHAQELLNYYSTGDYNNNKRSGNLKGGVLSVLRDMVENGRGNSQITETGGGDDGTNLIRDGIWSTVLS